MLERDDCSARPVGTWIPRARAVTSASGESAAPTVSSRHPRRAASAATASGPSARPDSETATTRSTGPTQPGRVLVRTGWTGTGAPGPARAASRSPTTAEPPRADTTTARGRPSSATRATSASAASVAASRTCAPAEARARRVLRESASARASTSSRSRSSSGSVMRLGALGPLPDPVRPRGRIVEQHHRDVVTDRERRTAVGADDRRGLVVGHDGFVPRARAGQDLQQQRIEVHHASPRTRTRTSSRSRSMVGRSAASTLRRSRGSVLLGRRLNHQSAADDGQPVEVVDGDPVAAARTPSRRRRSRPPGRRPPS